MVRAVLILAAVLGIVLFGWPGSENGEPPSWVTPREGDGVAIAGHGFLESVCRPVVVPAGVSGRLESVAPDGTAVRAGDPVAWVSRDTLEEAVRASRQELATRRAEVMKSAAAADVEAQGDDRAVAGARARWFGSQRLVERLDAPPDAIAVRELELKLERARLVEAAAAREQETEAAQVRRGFAPELDHDPAAADLVRARVERARLERQLALRRRGASPLEQQRVRALLERSSFELEQAEQTRRTRRSARSAALARLVAGVTAAARQHAQREQLLGLTTLVAPVDGTVVHGRPRPGRPLASIGAPVQAGAVVLLVVAREELHARVELEPADASRAAPGQPAVASVEGMRGSLPGRVVAVERQGDGSAVAVVHLSVDGPSLRPGMRCRVTIEVARHRNALRIPLAAVWSREAGRVIVMISRGEGPRPVSLKRIDEDGQDVLVEGLSRGEPVLVGQGGQP